MHYQVLLRVGAVAFSADSVATTRPSLYTKALGETRHESIEKTVRKPNLFAARAMARQHEGRLPSPVMIAFITGGEGRERGRQPKTWHRCLLEGVKAYRDTEG